jgi:DNA-binding NarL/FixJ family response regulator
MTTTINVLVAGNRSAPLKTMIGILRSLQRVKVAGVVTSGEEIINMYDQLKPDVIFLDAVMDEMSGFETARLIKEQNKNIRIIICSSKFDREFLLAVLSLKLDGYLPGYGNHAVIAETLETIVNNRSYFHYGVGHQQLKNLTAYQYLQLLPPVNKKYSINDN